MDQNNSEYGHFLRNVMVVLILENFITFDR